MNFIKPHEMKKTILLLLIIAVGLPAAIAQKFSFDFDAKATDYTSIGKRKLAVELLEEDGRAISKFTRNKEDYPKGVENYQKYVRSYNENMKNLMPKFWKLNTTIEFKTPKEVKKLIEARDKDYVILQAKEVGGGEEFITRFDGTAISLILFRAEKSGTIDYKIMLPYSSSRNDQCNTTPDFTFTIQAAAANIEYMMEKKTTATFPDFMETKAIANCKDLKDKTLLLEPDVLSPKADKKTIKEYYDKKFEVLKKDLSLVNNAVETQDPAMCYVVLIPYSTYQNPFASEPRTYVLCYKLIVNAADGKIMNYMEGKAKNGDDVSLLQEKDFKQLNSCDK